MPPLLSHLRAGLKKQVKQRLDPQAIAMARRLLGRGAPDLDALRVDRQHDRVAVLLDSDDPTTRIRATRILGEFLHTASSSVVVERLDAAAARVGEGPLGPRPSATPVDGCELRQQIECAGRVPHGAARQALMALARGERRRWVQHRALLALLLLGDVEASFGTEALLALEAEELPLQGGSIRTMSLMPVYDRPQTIHWLLASMFPSHGKNWWKSKTKRWLRDPSFAPNAREDKGADAIKASLLRRRIRTDPADQEHLWSLVHLGQIGRDTDFEPLHGFFQGAPDEGLKRAAIEGIGRHGDPRSVERLLPLLTGELAPSAALALGRISSATATAALAGALPSASSFPAWGEGEAESADPTADTARAVLWALGEIGDPAAASALLPFLDRGAARGGDEPRPGLAAYAVDALIKCGPEVRGALSGVTGDTARAHAAVVEQALG